MNLASIVDPHDEAAVALISRGQRITYGELRGMAAELRGGLASLGIEPGDRVALVVANNPLFVAGYLAVLGLGAVAVPLNPASPSAEIRGELTAVGARAALVGPSGRDAFAGIGPGATPLEHIVAPAGVDLPGATVLEEVSGAAPRPAVDRDPGDLAVLAFTSGTAGAPRAAKLTHGNLLANLDQVQRHPGRALGPDDVCLGVLPLFHIFGLNVVLGLTLHAGASVLLVERFDPASALDSLRNHGVTVVPGAPPMFQAWSTMPIADDDEDDPFATVRLAVSGAAALSPDVAAAFRSRFGLEIFEGYGLTEAAPTVTSSVGARPRPGSVGVPLPGLEVRLVDDDGDDVVVGDAGEIWVRGPNVFSGYWEDDEATARALTQDGWLRTGDVGIVDDEGFLYLVDRAKDIVIVSGFNVYPAEVEQTLREHPNVADAAVVGVPHPHSGETVKAFVVAADGRPVEEDQLTEFCAGRLARYKCPTKITFVEQLPQGAGGKLLRRSLPT